MARAGDLREKIVESVRQGFGEQLEYTKALVRFESTRGAEFFDSNQRAQAWTAAYLYEHDSHWLAAAEWLRISGSLHQRELLGLPAEATEQQLQMVLRYSF